MNSCSDSSFLRCRETWIEEHTSDHYTYFMALKRLLKFLQCLIIHQHNLDICRVFCTVSTVVRSEENGIYGQPTLKWHENEKTKFNTKCVKTWQKTNTMCVHVCVHTNARRRGHCAVWPDQPTVISYQFYKYKPHLDKAYVLPSLSPLKGHQVNLIDPHLNPPGSKRKTALVRGPGVNGST